MREFYIYMPKHMRRGINIIAKLEKTEALDNNHLREPAIRVIEYSAVVELRRSLQEAQLTIHSEFCSTGHHAECLAFNDIITRYGGEHV